jgi:tRNA-specific 2-thiouridylase
VERLEPAAALDGDIVDADGHVLGRHRGVINFTVGQRKGLGLAHGEPLFVTELDAANRRVVVGNRSSLRAKTIALRDVNWLAGGADAVDCAVKVRSMRPPVAARVIPLADRAARVELADFEEAVAPGQACVFYERDGSRVIGGGWIARAERNARAVA